MCDLDKAIDIDETLPEVYYYKALALENSWKNYPGALEFYSKAIQLDPCNSAYWTDRALLYKDFLKEYQKCIEDFDQALKYKQSGYYLSQQAHAYTLLGDLEKAQQFLEQGLKLSPRLRIHKYVEATICLKQRRYGRAKILYAEFVEGTFSDVAYYKAPVSDAKNQHKWISLQSKRNFKNLLIVQKVSTGNQKKCYGLVILILRPCCHNFLEKFFNWFWIMLEAMHT